MPIELPPALADSSFGPWLRRVLRNKPAERDVTAAALLDALEQFDPDALETLATASPPATATPDTATFAQPHAGQTSARGGPVGLPARGWPEPVYRSGWRAR